MFDLFISHDNTIYTPVVISGVSLSSFRTGSPASLKFSFVFDGITFAEGDAVSFSYGSYNLFFGFIFTISSNSNTVSITAYDQLRYFANRDSYIYEGKTASQVLSFIAEDFNLVLGDIEDTSYVIPYRVEENTSLFDIVYTALDLTLQNTSQMFVLFDDFGKISLKNISSLLLDIQIDADVFEDFSYSSSIDKNSFNQVKLVYENSDTGTRDVYLAYDNNNISSWGVLQYFDTLKEGENGVAKATALMDLYDRKSKKISLSNVLGDVRVRAGCLLYISINCNALSLNSIMLVESVVHSFSDNSHFMNLVLSGGEFSV